MTPYECLKLENGIFRLDTEDLVEFAYDVVRRLAVHCGIKMSNETPRFPSQVQGRIDKVIVGALDAGKNLEVADTILRLLYAIADDIKAQDAQARSIPAEISESAPSFRVAVDAQFAKRYDPAEAQAQWDHLTRLLDKPKYKDPK